MTLDPLERAARLRHEAGQLLRDVRLYEILEPFGPVFMTGSFYLDTMAYPDIDLEIPPVTLAQLFQIGGQLAQYERVSQVIFERSKDPRLPGGLYLKPRIEQGDWGRPWKIDIWSLERSLIAEQRDEMERIRARLTPPLREQIIRYKVSVLTSGHRTPMGTGYWIYRAFLDEGLSDFAEVSRYLAAHGIAFGP